MAKRMMGGMLSWEREPSVQKKVLFLHVPKCGGTSVDRAVRAGFGGPRKCHHLNAQASEAAGSRLEVPLTGARELILAYMAESEGAQYISGHFRFTSLIHQLHGEGWQIITVLRNPVEKWLSQYFYNATKKSEHFRIEESLEDFVKTDRARNYGCDFINNFAPHIPPEKQAEEEAIDETIAVLKKKCCLVGFTDKLDDFSAAMEREFGFSPSIGVQNINPASKEEKSKLLTPELQEHVKQLCQPNQMVYDSLLNYV
ncbi:MAG: sulfotransferase family 2 domain-containing protein [Planctomycetes bacterium]|nr:sulfotransferase family 2 domain-containing protein [Planctomycetota bacterium]